jgi:hypothetical protein
VTAEEDPVDAVAAADERVTLRTFLGAYRATLARKADGLTDEQARLATCPPSDLTMLGLVRHMADVERGWAHRAFLGVDAPTIYYGAAHPDGDMDGDFHPPSGATLADALATYWQEIASADRVYASASLDSIGLDARDDRPRYSLRWIYVHLIEEYARHCGHADLIRQVIDGSAGE